MAKAKSKKPAAKANKMTVEVKNGMLVISMPMIEQVSKSGKSVVIATTSGNKDTGIEHNGHNIILGVNAYIPNEDVEDEE